MDNLENLETIAVAFACVVFFILPIGAVVISLIVCIIKDRNIEANSIHTLSLDNNRPESSKSKSDDGLVDYIEDKIKTTAITKKQAYTALYLYLNTIDNSSLFNATQIKKQIQQYGWPDSANDVLAITKVIDITKNLVSEQVGDTPTDRWYNFNLNILAEGVASFLLIKYNFDNYYYFNQVHALISRSFSKNIADTTIVKVAYVKHAYIGYQDILLYNFKTLCSNSFTSDKLYPHLRVIATILAFNYITPLMDTKLSLDEIEEKGNDYYSTMPELPSISNNEISDLFATALFHINDLNLNKSISNLFNDKKLGILIEKKVSILNSNLALISHLANCSVFNIINNFSANELDIHELHDLRQGIHYSTGVVVVAFNLLKHNLIN